MAGRGIEEGGLGPFDPQLFIDLDMADYRTRFPTETAGLSDEQIFHVVSCMDDDTDDGHEFKEAST